MTAQQNAESLNRLASFGANIADAHSCFIFLPARCFSSDARYADRGDLLQLGGFHSLSQDIIPGCVLSAQSGLIGWVARYKSPIHVSPFEHDSRTLGTYREDQQLKSFVGIPIHTTESSRTDDLLAGVIACDSKKSFAFSKLQTKLLENLAAEITNNLQLIALTSENQDAISSWQGFINKSLELVSAIGADAVEILRIIPSDLEAQVGTGGSIEFMEQILRLFKQSLPPHFPILRLPNGEIVLAVDNMMTSLFENKFRGICDHVTCSGHQLTLNFRRARTRKTLASSTDIERLVTSTADLQIAQLTKQKEARYGIGRS